MAELLPHSPDLGFDDADVPDLVSPTISKDVAQGNLARENSLLSSIRKKTKFEHGGRSSSSNPPLPPQSPLDIMLLDSFAERSPPPVAPPPPPRNAAPPGGFAIRLPKDWKPTWPTAFGDANGGFISEADDGSDRTTGLSHGEEISDQIPNPGAQAESVGSHKITAGLRNSQMQIQGGSSSRLDLHNLKLDPYSKPEHMPTVAHLLAQIGDQTLGFDLRGNSKEAKFFSHVLDIVEKVNTLNSILWQRVEFCDQEHVIVTSDNIEHLESLVPLTKDQPPASPPKDGPHMRVLHCIFCPERRHNHHMNIFEDEPREVDDTEAKEYYHKDTSDLKLHAEKRIRDLDSYLKAYPHICFVVFREHICRTSQDAEHKLRDSVDAERVSARKERLLIVSHLLKEKIKEMATCLPKISRFRISGSCMDAPYLFLYHHREQIAKLLEHSDEKTRKHGALLCDFLEQTYKEEYSEADEQFKRGVVSRKHLDKLFKPNQILIQQANGKPRAYVLRDWPEGDVTSGDVLSLTCWSWNFDGRKLSRDNAGKTIVFDIKESMPITELACFPSTYASHTTLQILNDRGRKYWSLRQKSFVAYSGWDGHHEAQYSNSRLMIDMSTYKKLHKEDFRRATLTPTFAKDKFWATEISVTDDIDDPNLMLLPPHMPGFEMRSKEWILLNVEQIEPVTWNHMAFERLVLEEKSKELIKALVTVHVSTNKMSDIISGKGAGLIILLHGSPGTGKTLTAESVAELAEKPLYRVTCGDIGTEPAKIESYLATVMYLGKIWDCVLLIDEADVFLEERTMADIQRNSIVSVFPRMLEFYDGILILTSNRVGTFDDAFNSRIQVALHYGPLTKKSRKQIWQNFLEILEEQDVEVDVSELEPHLEELAGADMNGRQIRNCVLTAQQLACYKQERLGWEHLSQAMKTSIDFQKYLKNVHGHTSEQWAREERLR